MDQFLNNGKIFNSSVNGLYRVDADNIPSTSITDKCIVLDLDQTLIATQDSISSLKQLGILTNPQYLDLRQRIYYITIEDIEKPGKGSKYDYWGITRPHINEFLIFCFSYFKVVAVWSAGKRPYVESIVDHIFRGIRQPHIIFTYDDVVIGPNGHIEKPLINMINSNPIIEQYMSLDNTFALDDNSMTFSQNPDNGILISAYEPPLNINAFYRDDPSLLQLKYWLLQQEVVATKDVKTLDKKSIFSISLDNYKSQLQSVPGYKFL